MKCILIILFALLNLSPLALAESSSKYLISLRNGGTEGTAQIEFYHSNLIEFRYFISERFDLGISFEQSQRHPIEMSKRIEVLDPSLEIDSFGDSSLLTAFSAFHPWGRRVKWNLDSYFGVALKDIVVKPDDVTLPGYYHLEVRTPPAIGVFVKVGNHWFFRENFALTIELDAGRVYSHYWVVDRVTGTTDRFVTHNLISGTIGASYQF